MTSAAWALQQSIFMALSGNVTVTGLLGGARIFDDVPRGAQFPYVTFGQSTMRDFSTGSEEGREHVVTLHVWSRAAGRKEAHEIIDALREALHDASLTLTGHRLVNLRYELSDARRDPDGETYQGIVRYRAVTEPLP